jgi:hypothetical protein
LRPLYSRERNPVPIDKRLDWPQRQSVDFSEEKKKKKKTFCPYWDSNPGPSTP